MLHMKPFSPGTRLSVVCGNQNNKCSIRMLAFDSLMVSGAASTSTAGFLTGSSCEADTGTIRVSGSNPDITGITTVSG